MELNYIRETGEFELKKSRKVTRMKMKHYKNGWGIERTVKRNGVIIDYKTKLIRWAA